MTPVNRAVLYYGTQCMENEGRSYKPSKLGHQNVVFSTNTVQAGATHTTLIP